MFRSMLLRRTLIDFYFALFFVVALHVWRKRFAHGV